MISKLVEASTPIPSCYVKDESGEQILGFESIDIANLPIVVAENPDLTHFYMLHYFGDTPKTPLGNCCLIESLSEVCLFANTILSWIEDEHPVEDSVEEILIDVFNEVKSYKKYGAGVLCYGYDYKLKQLYISKIRGEKDCFKKHPKYLWAVTISKESAREFAEEIKRVAIQ